MIQSIWKPRSHLLYMETVIPGLFRAARNLASLSVVCYLLSCLESCRWFRCDNSFQYPNTKNAVSCSCVWTSHWYLWGELRASTPHSVNNRWLLPMSVCCITGVCVLYNWFAPKQWALQLLASVLGVLFMCCLTAVHGQPPWRSWYVLYRLCRKQIPCFHLIVPSRWIQNIIKR